MEFLLFRSSSVVETSIPTMNKLRVVHAESLLVELTEAGTQMLYKSMDILNIPQ